MTRVVREAGYPGVGDRDDLVPRALSGRRPADVTPAELVEASLVGLAGLGDEYANSWWANRKPDSATDSTALARGTSALRALQYRGRRAAAQVADRNALVGRLAGEYIRRRTR